MFKYEYIGDQPTVFITLQKNGSTWVPQKGDTITSPIPISHPLLELVVKEVPQQIEIPEIQQDQTVIEPEDKKPSAVVVDEKVKE